MLKTILKLENLNEIMITVPLVLPRGKKDNVYTLQYNSSEVKSTCVLDAVVTLDDSNGNNAKEPYYLEQW